MFLGHTGEWWDFWAIIAAIFAAVAAAAIGVTTVGSIISHKREAVAAGQALQEYKVETGKQIFELEAFKAPRVVSAEARDKIVSEMKWYPKTPVVFGVFNDPESIGLLEQISSALLSAGWIEEEWKSGGDIVMTRRNGHPAAGYINSSSLYVEADVRRSAGLQSNRKITG